MGTRGKRSDGGKGGGKEEVEREFSLEEVVKVEPDRAEFESPEATQVLKDSTHDIENKSRHVLATKMRCTDLDHFFIIPATAILKPGVPVNLTISRRPHFGKKDQRVDIYYARWPGSPDDPKPNIPAFFRRRRAPHIVLLIRLLKELAKSASARKIFSDHEKQTPLTDADRDPSPIGRATGNLRHPPPPLRLDESEQLLPQPLGLKCLFFPPFNQQVQLSFSVLNPSHNHRVAVNVRLGDHGEQFDIRPSYMFLCPGDQEEMVVRRLPVGAPNVHRCTLALFNLAVSVKDKDWKAVWKDADRAEMSEARVELEVRSEPYLNCQERHVTFYKPHFLKSLSALTVKNISPIWTFAKIYTDGKEQYRAYPARAVIAPNSQLTIYFAPTKMPMAESVSYVVSYCGVGDEVAKGAAEWLGTKVKQMVEKELGAKDSRVVELTGRIRRSEEAALEVEPGEAVIRGPDGARLTLRNRAAAPLAVKVRAADPERFVSTVARLVLAPGESKELFLSTKPGGKSSLDDSAIRLLFAFCFNPNKHPDRALSDAREKDGSVTSVTVPILSPAFSSRSRTIAAVTWSLKPLNRCPLSSHDYLHQSLLRAVLKLLRSLGASVLALEEGHREYNTALHVRSASKVLHKDTCRVNNCQRKIVLE